MVEFSAWFLPSPNFLDMQWAILGAGSMVYFQVHVGASTWFKLPALKF